MFQRSISCMPPSIGIYEGVWVSSPFEASSPVPVPWIPVAPSSWAPALHPEPGPTLALKGPVLSSLRAQACRDQFPDRPPARRGTELFQPVLQALSSSLDLHLSGCPPPPAVSQAPGGLRASILVIQPVAKTPTGH